MKFIFGMFLIYLSTSSLFGQSVKFMVEYNMDDDSRQDVKIIIPEGKRDLPNMKKPWSCNISNNGSKVLGITCKENGKDKFTTFFWCPLYDEFTKRLDLALVGPPHQVLYFTCEN